MQEEDYDIEIIDDCLQRLDGKLYSPTKKVAVINRIFDFITQRMARCAELLFWLQIFNICLLYGLQNRHQRISARIRTFSSLFTKHNAMDNTDGSIVESIRTKDILSLDSIRSTLIRQEETIIFALIERAQYHQNQIIYNPQCTNIRNVYGAPLSFLEYMLIETERLHAKVRRYTSPEEHAFFEQFLPDPILPELTFPPLLSVQKSEINVNDEILRWYTQRIIRRLCKKGDDEQHGSSVLCDINALQAISRRVHFGKFVAESKFQAMPEKFAKLVQDDDVLGILDALTDKEVEKKVLQRAFIKACHYGQDILPIITSGRGDATSIEEDSNKTISGSKIDPMLIVDIYRDMIIPLTKDVEVRYLYRKLQRKSPEPTSYYPYCRGPLDAFKDVKHLPEIQRTIEVNPIARESLQKLSEGNNHDRSNHNRTTFSQLWPSTTSMLLQSDDSELSNKIQNINDDDDDSNRVMIIV